MPDFDFERFNETAAFLEYCDGMSRFEAETEAARRQGVKRHDAIRMGNLEQSRDQRSSNDRDATNNLPGVQPHEAKQNGSLLVSHVQVGWGCVALLALFVCGGPVL